MSLGFPLMGGETEAPERAGIPHGAPSPCLRPSARGLPDPHAPEQGRMPCLPARPPCPPPPLAVNRPSHWGTGGGSKWPWQHGHETGPSITGLGSAWSSGLGGLTWALTHLAGGGGRLCDSRPPAQHLRAWRHLYHTLPPKRAVCLGVDCASRSKAHTPGA